MFGAASADSRPSGGASSTSPRALTLTLSSRRFVQNVDEIVLKRNSLLTKDGKFMKPNSTLSVANNVGKSISFKSFDGAQRGVSTLGIPREFVIVENIRQVCLLDITSALE